MAFGITVKRGIYTVTIGQLYCQLLCLHL